MTTILAIDTSTDRTTVGVVFADQNELFVSHDLPASKNINLDSKRIDFAEREI